MSELNVKYIDIGGVKYYIHIIYSLCFALACIPDSKSFIILYICIHKHMRELLCVCETENGLGSRVTGQQTGA